MKSSVLIGTGVGLLCLFRSAEALAGCSIHNDTGWSFTVTSGNTSNQRVGAHTQTSIASGKIIGKSKEGKTFSGVCKDGDKLELKDDHGVPILLHK
ncbi:MAG TPA: hypothetical protein VMF89_16030 [Polyangiales bacterium]|nr:hypothetical protein [Polyangiales bacterium]